MVNVKNFFIFLPRIKLEEENERKQPILAWNGIMVRKSREGFDHLNREVLINHKLAHE